MKKYCTWKYFGDWDA